MAQKCDGVKILDLEGKDKFTGNEYVVVAEKDENYKIPMEQIGDVIINGSKFKAAIEKVYTSSTPTAAVTLADSEFKFSFGIPPGERGDNGYNGRDGKDGKDGKDGIDGVPGIDGDTVRTILAYKSTTTTTRPATPVGGSWDAATNIVIYPDGWTGNDANPNGYVWMSSASFSSNGTQMSPWTTPLRLTGDDGKDGSDGTNIEFIYKLTISSLVIPTKPTGNSQQEAIDNWGWTDHPTGISEEFQCEWVCSHSLQEDGTWGEWQGPTIWSKWGVNGKDGDGVEYIFQRTKLPAPPHNITDNNPDQDEYIPASYPGEERWTDDPSGVNETYKYEWVSKRKYKGDTHKWGNFSSPALWAKYGDDGQDGIHLKVMYTRTASSEVKPPDPERLNINPGSIWSVAMPSYSYKEAIWGIQALVTYDNKLFIDENVPEEERGWQGPYQVTGVPGLDGNSFNYQVDAFKESVLQPEKPTGNDPYNPGDGWMDLPDHDTGTWWKCTALVQGETGVVIEWGAVVRVTGQGIVIKGTLDNEDQLPQTGNQIGDAYVIDGYLWVWNGERWVNVGQAQGPNGNYTEIRYARNDSWADPPSIDKTSRNPSGWSTTNTPASQGRVMWMTSAIINGADNTLLENWLDPWYVTGATGNPGQSGIPGVNYELRYCAGTANDYTATWNDTVRRTRDPQSYGWDKDLPTVTDENKYIWFIQARIAYINNEDREGYLEDGHWQAPHLLSGINGLEPAGDSPIIYPMGIYATDITYINDTTTAPYVYDTSDDAFYLLNTPTTWLGTQQGNKYPSDAPGVWTKFEMFDAMFADFGILRNALIGGAVFNNELMFSQWGTGGSHYERINPDNPVDPSNSWNPSFCLDFKSGDAWFGEGAIHLSPDKANTVIDINNRNSQGTGTSAILSMTDLSFNQSAPSSNPTANTTTSVGKSGLSIDTGVIGCTLDENGFRFGTYSTSGNLLGRYNTTFGILPDGAGMLAGANISWNSAGSMIISQPLYVNEIRVGSPTFTITSDGIAWKSTTGTNADAGLNGIYGNYRFRNGICVEYLG